MAGPGVVPGPSFSARAGSTALLRFWRGAGGACCRFDRRGWRLIHCSNEGPPRQAQARAVTQKEPRLAGASTGKSSSRPDFRSNKSTIALLWDQVAEARRIIDAQHALLEKLRVAGAPTREAEGALRTYASSLMHLRSQASEWQKLLGPAEAIGGQFYSGYNLSPGREKVPKAQNVAIERRPKHSYEPHQMDSL
jgi:hypothetical protein